MIVRQMSRLLAAALLSVVINGVVQAQETVNSASLSGRITDAQGAVVPGAQVTARDTEAGVTTETVSDAEGRFRFPYLRVGQYEVKVHVPGFADSTRSVRLTIGSAFDLPVSIAIAGMAATVSVTSDAP